MMVDDEEGALTRPLQDSLRRGEVQLETCADVSQALQRFRDTEYDLVLLASGLDSLCFAIIVATTPASFGDRSLRAWSSGIASLVR